MLREREEPFLGGEVGDMWHLPVPLDGLIPHSVPGLGTC